MKKRLPKVGDRWYLERENRTYLVLSFYEYPWYSVHKYVNVQYNDVYGGFSKGPLDVNFLIKNATLLTN